MNILEEVNARYETLSPTQKRIADFIFKYPDEVCFYSLKDLAQALGVTEVTILRFTKKIGLTSFVEMKKMLREHLQSSMSRGDLLNRVADHIGKPSVENDDKEDMLSRFAANETAVIQNTYRQIKLENILEAVAIIRQAQMVYVVGNELITGISSYLARRLLTIGVKVMDLSFMSRALYNDCLSHVGPEDAVIIFSLPGYAKHVVNTSRYLEKKRVPQIVITDRENSPVALHGTTVLTCDNRDLFFYNSVLGFLSVSSMLAYFTALDDPEETNRLRGRVSEVREAVGSVDLVQR